MQRIQGATVEQDLYGAGKPGFQEGDPAAQIPATVVSAAFLNALQEEIARAVELGDVLDPNNPGQLAALLAPLFATRTLTRDVPLNALEPFCEPAGTWQHHRLKVPSENSLWGNSQGILYLVLAPYVPHQATIVRVEAGVQPRFVKTGSDRMRFDLCMQNAIKHPLDQTFARVRATAYASTNEKETVTLTPSLTMTGEGAYLTIKASNTSSAFEDDLYGLSVTYSESVL